MRNTPLLIALLFLLSLVAACKPDNSYKTPDWDLSDVDKEEDEPKKKERKVHVADPKGNYYLWIEANPNFEDYANSTDKIKRDLQKAADAGYTDIVVDVRPTDGNILFKSATGTPHTWAPGWFGGTPKTGMEYKKVYRTASFDYLQAFIDEGHKLGLRIHAGFNTWIGGVRNNLGNSGILYTDKTKKSWAVVLNMKNGLVSIMDDSKYDEKFLNPANDEAQAYLITLLRDLAAYEDLDGIILDRCRYPGLLGDFSNESKTKFLEYIGKTDINWPSDVMPAGTDYLACIDKSFVQPKYFRLWLEFRAKTIHDFIEKVSNEVHDVNPDICLGVYVGGWYEQYYDFGVNWASPLYPTQKYFPKWATTKYQNYGYADHLDQMLIGAYTSPESLYGTWEWSIQGFCSLAKDKIKDSCPIIAGGPDVGNWTEDHYGLTTITALRMGPKVCTDACGGFFTFDMIHLKWYDYWNYLKEGISKSKASR